MKFSVIERTPDEHTVYARDAFARRIGQQLNVTTPNGILPGTLVAAEVAEDGRAVELTFDVPGLEHRLDWNVEPVSGEA